MKTSRRVLLVAGLIVVPSVVSLPAAAPTSAHVLPVYNLKIAPEEWTKLQRAPGSDDRHPAQFIAAGREYSVKIRYRGDWARSWPKKPLKVFFEKDHEFEGNHVLNLNPNWRDPAFIREQLAYHIYAACGAPCSRTRMVKVNVNGQFHGVFLEVEQPDKPFLKRNNLKGAAIYKGNSHDWMADERDLGAEAAFHAHYEKETLKSDDYRDLQSFCHDLARTKNVAEFFATRVEVDRYVNFLAGNVLVQNWDWFTKNHFVIHDVAGSSKWLAVPWDLDRTLGDHWSGPFDAANVPLRLGTSAQPGNIGWNKVFNAFYNEPTLRQRLLERLEVLLQTEFTKGKLFPVLDRWESELSADVALDRKRWPNRSAGDLHEGIAGVKQFIEERRAYLLREIKAQGTSKTSH